MTKTSKRHHYTPRYYLKRFENEDGGLWRLDRDTGAVVHGNNERFGFKNQWNSLRNPPPGYKVDWAEAKLAEIDGLAAGIIARILNGEFPADIAPLAYAISFMVHNQPRLMRELADKHPDQVGHWTSDHRLVVKMKTALDAAPSYIPLYYAVQRIDPSDTDARFLTSGNPVIDFSNQPTKFMPLSSRHCLFMSWDPAHRHFTPRTYRCPPETVAGINARAIENAWQYVYSSTPSFAP